MEKSVGYTISPMNFLINKAFLFGIQTKGLTTLTTLKQYLTIINNNFIVVMPILKQFYNC
jgi:hypothetical protein